jgi:hypothetical protein
MQEKSAILYDFEAIFEEIQSKIISAKNQKPPENHHRNLDGANPIRITTSSCKRP